MDFIKSYFQITVAIVTIVVSLAAQWAVYGVRLNALEDRQNRQSEDIAEIRGQILTQVTSTAELNAKVDAMSDNINYIRSRIDAIAK